MQTPFVCPHSFDSHFDRPIDPIMKIREIRSAGLRGATPEGGWSNELRPEDCVHTLIAVHTDEGAVGQPVTALLPAPGLREAALEVLASGKPQRGLQLEMPWQGGTRSLRVTITGTRLE